VNFMMTVFRGSGGELLFVHGTNKEGGPLLGGGEYAAPHVKARGPAPSLAKSGGRTDATLELLLRFIRDPPCWEIPLRIEAGLD